MSKRSIERSAVFIASDSESETESETESESESETESQSSIGAANPKGLAKGYSESEMKRARRAYQEQLAVKDAEADFKEALELKEAQLAEERLKHPENEALIVLQSMDALYQVEKVLIEGVCGKKKPCIVVIEKVSGKKLILKEVTKAFHYGRDYMCINSLKEMFGVRAIDMRREKLNRAVDWLWDEVEKKYQCYWVSAPEGRMYCVMGFQENVGDLGKWLEGVKKEQKMEQKSLGKRAIQSNPDIMMNPKMELVFTQMMEIRLFDGLFLSSDNISRNILVLKEAYYQQHQETEEEGESPSLFVPALLSIDENDLFGKRGKIFNPVGDIAATHPWCIANAESIWRDMIQPLGDQKRAIEKMDRVLRQWGIVLPANLNGSIGPRFHNFVQIIKAEHQEIKDKAEAKAVKRAEVKQEAGNKSVL